MGTAARFDAASDRISYTGGDTPPDTATGMAFTCWAYLSVDQNDFSAILRMHAASGSSTRVNFATGSSGETPCLFSPGNTTGVAAPAPLVASAWRPVGCSITGTTGTIYIASSDLTTVQSASGTVSGGSAVTGFTLGGRSPSDASEWFNGRIKYPRMFGTTLTQPEIVSEWGSTTMVNTGSIWGAWVLSGPGDLNDVSGNGRHLTAGATAVTAEAGPPIDPPDFAKGAQFLSFF